MYINVSAPKITNAVFHNNIASDVGGIYIRGSWPELTNVTFSGNQATNLGGGVYNGSRPYGFDSETTLANAILWGDVGEEIYNDSTSVITVTYSLVQGGWPGTGNINADPLFVDAPSGNLRLKSASPAIDAGNNAVVPSGIVTDLDGNPRFVDGNGDGNVVVDMGAYERQDAIAPTVVSIVRLDASPTNAASVRFRVTFSEAVNGVDAGDFSLTATGISGASVTGVSGDGAVYTVTVGTGSGAGTLRLDVPATATITDLAGNPLSDLPYTSGEAYMVRASFIYLPLVLRNTP